MLKLWARSGDRRGRPSPLFSISDVLYGCSIGGNEGTPPLRHSCYMLYPPLVVSVVVTVVLRSTVIFILFRALLVFSLFVTFRTMESSNSWELQALGYLTVGMLWGVTNPFIKRAAEKASKERADAPRPAAGGSTSTGAGTGAASPGRSHLATLRHFCTEPRIFVPFLVNQTGSLVFYYLLSKEPVSRTAPVCNALTFIFTALTGYLVLKEDVRSPLLLGAGSLLVVLGTYFCVKDAPTT